jgi:hypothetical protein
MVAKQTTSSELAAEPQLTGRVDARCFRRLTTPHLLLDTTHRQIHASKRRRDTENAESRELRPAQKRSGDQRVSVNCATPVLRCGVK